MNARLRQHCRIASYTCVICIALPGLVSRAQTNQDSDFRQYTIEQFLETTNFGGASFAPDNTRILVSSDQSGVMNAYAIPVDGGQPEMLTNSTVESISTLGYFPDDERFLYTSDQGGNELNHIYLRRLDGSAQDLTPGQNLKAQFYGWSGDDRSFFIATNERDERFFDVYQYDATTLKRELIFRNDDGFMPSDISRDGQKLALAKVSTRDDSDIFVFDRSNDQISNVTAHEGDVTNMGGTFSPDGRSLYFVTDAGREFQYLVRLELDSGDRSIVRQLQWDVSQVAFSKQGNYLLVGINEDGRSKLELYDAKDMTRLELPDFPGASVSSITISPDERHLAIYVDSDKMPRDLFYLEMGGEQPIQLTSSLNADIDSSHLVGSKVVRFDSFDGQTIPGILYKPHQASAANKVPALVWVHGGPGGQSRVGYQALMQFLLNHGYAIYAINNRGSSGYGKSFQKMDDRNHGKGDLGDCVASKKMLIDTGWVDPDRIGIIGGSYGGYMVLAALTFAPEDFDVGVDLFGISNWHRTVQNIPPWWEAQRNALEKEMGDFDDIEYFKSISPLFHSDQIRRPLMVLQGANDPRVLKVESDEIVEAVRTNGVPVAYVVFEDEGHGFRKKANQLRGYNAVLEFLDQHLKMDQHLKQDD